jgi:hypothetical protein
VYQQEKRDIEEKESNEPKTVDIGEDAWRIGGRAGQRYS